MNNKWNLIVDVASCSNCGNCTLAVKDEYVGNNFPGYSAAQPAKGHKWFWVDRVVRGSGTGVDVAHVPKACNHCEDPPCQKVAPDVVKKRKDGIVIFDPAKAVGRHELVEACPYGAVSWNEEKQLPQIWSFDAHLLDAGWERPRCVQVCPTGSLSALKISDADMDALTEEQGLVVLEPELGTKPRIHYRNLWRAHEHFVFGNVVGSDSAGRATNLAGVEVYLTVEGIETRTVLTNDFGDFKFDRLKTGQTYSISIEAGESRTVCRSGVIDQSIDFGQLVLVPPGELAATPGEY